ncbi:GNAT family N-acetyltransferase [Ornithinimicrobium sp. F0845]|uniref:GNAT family N-acetyltransferase n=1 Tax=Ornithinimicrobium sp. F0845 TaxID=2926412 RepID=UPI001FF5D51B|nr:GNAT family N-acetyltransferase [Ornithinimicrobium sp. F0845]MCK0110705.1 GNAT family N-acetyltransferase [Ornithinimicrobium sp. F0845]
MSLTWRTVTRDDVRAVVAFTNLVGERDGTGEVTTEQATTEMFEAPRFDVSTDVVTVWEDDELVGLGSVFCRDTVVEGRAMVSVQGAVHPDHRDRGLGSELLNRLEARARELATERLPGEPVRLRTSGGLPDSSAQRLLEDRRYRPDNYFITMQVQLADWVDQGEETAAVRPDAEQLSATRDAHNDAFRDHRNFSPIPEDHWEFWGKSSTQRPEQSRVVVEGDRVLAYSLVAEHEPGVSHVELVGTRREARGRGLARQVLLSSLRAARAAGQRVSELEVDSTSPTGADRLYVSVGYQPVRVVSRYVRDVD